MRLGLKGFISEGFGRGRWTVIVMSSPIVWRREGLKGLVGEKCKDSKCGHVWVHLRDVCPRCGTETGITPINVAGSSLTLYHEGLLLRGPAEAGTAFYNKPIR